MEQDDELHPSEDDELHPDLRLKNLFFYVNPNCLGDAGRNALKTGDDLLAQLSAGKIVAWGRSSEKGVQKQLTKIPSKYWRNAAFDYEFFCDDTSIQVEPLPGCSGPSYSDLQFNREKVKAVWLKATREGPRYKDRWLSLWQRVGALFFARPKRDRSV